MDKGSFETYTRINTLDCDKLSVVYFSLENEETVEAGNNTETLDGDKLLSVFDTC